MMVEQYRREIELAIDNVKGRISSRQQSERKQTDVSRFRFHNGRFWNDAKEVTVPKGAREKKKDTTIILRGKVPRAFLKWFEDQQQKNWRNRNMLENCFFEER